MSALNYIGLIMMLLPMLMAWNVGSNTGTATGAAMVGLVAIVGAYYIAAGAMVVL